MSPSTRRFYKQIFTVTVLSEDSPVDESIGLSDLGAYITDGDGSGQITCVTEEIDAPTAAALLLDQGSEPEFFMLTEDGDDVVENV
jgi:hypothetical protein